MTLRAIISITILLSSPLASAGYDQARHFPSFPHPIWHASGRSSAGNHAQTHPTAVSSLDNQPRRPSPSTTLHRPRQTNSHSAR